MGHWPIESSNLSLSATRRRHQLALLDPSRELRVGHVCLLGDSVPVIDLRTVCSEAGDYSDVSPIESSGQGGAKIAQVIAEIVGRHDFSLRGASSNVFTTRSADG